MDLDTKEIGGANVACLAGISPLDFPAMTVLGVNHPGDTRGTVRVAGVLRSRRADDRDSRALLRRPMVCAIRTRQAPDAVVRAARGQPDGGFTRKRSRRPLRFEPSIGRHVRSITSARAETGAIGEPTPWRSGRLPPKLIQGFKRHSMIFDKPMEACRGPYGAGDREIERIGEIMHANAL